MGFSKVAVESQERKCSPMDQTWRSRTAISRLKMKDPALFSRRIEMLQFDPISADFFGQSHLGIPEDTSRGFSDVQDESVI